MEGLRYDGPENMPPGMRRLMEERERKQAGRGLRPEPGTARQVSARIPHQSQIGSEEPICASFPPGEAKAPAVQGKPNKYRNVETAVDGIRFQSIKEARRFEYLRMAAELGVIEDLRLQVDFTLQEGYKTAKGERIRAIRYVADFTYRVKSAGYDHSHLLQAADLEYWRGLWPGALVIEDTKSRGTRTKEYKIKRKLMADKGHEIREV